MFIPVMIIILIKVIVMDYFRKMSLALLGISQKKKLFQLDVYLERTLAITARTKYNASGTLALRINIYFSPDGINFDTIPYTYFDITVTAGAVCQRTCIIDTPEHGFFVVEAENLDTSYTQTQIEVVTNQSKWIEGGKE